MVCYPIYNASGASCRSAKFEPFPQRPLATTETLGIAYFDFARGI